jgi:hypothetical protein
VEANPTGDLNNSSRRGRVLTPANPRKDREHLYIGSRVLAICFAQGDLKVSSQNTTHVIPAPSITDALKSWVMVFLTLGFVVLYGLALIGKLKPLADASMVSRIEPIIFVIIGYYFGRLPAQQNESSLKDEIARQTQRADAAQHAKEQALLTRESLEEKVKNVNATLTSVASSASFTKVAEDVHKVGGSLTEDGLKYSVGAAIKILQS